MDKNTKAVILAAPIATGGLATCLLAVAGAPLIILLLAPLVTSQIMGAALTKLTKK